MVRLLLVPLLAAAAVVPFVGCGASKTTTANWTGHTVGPKVAVSFAPLHCFALNVVGDKGTVKSVLSTKGPHHADLGTDERTMLEGADVFVVNGLTLDDKFVADIEKSTSRKDLRVLNLGKGMKEDWLLHMDEDEKPAGDKPKKPAKPGHEGHDHGDHDPHVWLSPTLAVEMVKALRDDLKKHFPEFKDAYEANAKAYIAKLEALKADGNKLLKGRTERTIVTMHESLGYFANEFGLTIADSLHKVPGKEASGDELKRLIDVCLKQKVRVIAVEPQYSAAAAETLKEALVRAGITDAVVIQLDPLETATAADMTADFYDTKMRANLDALAKVLK